MKPGHLLLVLTVLLFFGRSATSQNKGNVTFPSASLANPGARSLALGGAVTGLADDASATELNPAGVTQIPRDEISIEYRQERHVYDQRYQFATQIGPTNVPGNLPCQDPLGVDTTVNSRCGTVASTLSRSFAFGSIVLHSRSGFSFGLYRHEIDSENATFTNSTLIFDAANGSGAIESGGPFSFQRRIDRTGLAIGYKVSDLLSLGISANENSLSYSSNQTFVWSTANQAPPLEGRSLGTTLQTGNENKFGYTAGILITPLHVFQVGASYSSKSRFKIAETDLECSLCSPGPTTNAVYSLSTVSNTFTLPAKFGIGVAFRPSHFNFVAEADRILYSENKTSSPQSWSDTVLINATGRPDDIWELRAGVEWLPLVSPSGSALAVRAGYYREPDHVALLSCTESNPISGADLGNCANVDPATDSGIGHALAAFYRDVAPPKRTTNHLSGGFGVVWAWGQVDLGYDRASNLHQDTFSATLVIRP